MMSFRICILCLNVCLVHPLKESFLNFGMLERPPHFMTKNVTTINNQPFQGSWVDAIEWLSRRLNFSYKIIPINNKETWSETSGRIQRGDFDVLGPPTVMMASRSRLFDYVGVFDEENSALVTPALTEESSILSTIKPFTPLVWLMLFVSLVLVSVYFSVSSSFTNDSIELNVNRHGRSLSIGDYVMYTIAILTNQGIVFYRPYQSKLSFRFTAGALCLLALVIVNLYCSTLTAHMTSRKMTTPPGGSIQVMEEGVLQYLVVADGLGRDIILSATSGPLKKMGDVFRRHPENFVPDQETCFLKVASGCCAFNALTNYLKYRVAEDFKETGKCRVHIGKPIRGYGFSGLILKKDNIIRNSINQGILELYQTGLVEYWRKKNGFGAASPCELQEKKKKKVLRRLNLQDLASAFLILGIGVSISLLVFLIEQCRRCRIFKISKSFFFKSKI